MENAMNAIPQRVKQGNIQGIDAIQIIGPFDFNDHEIDRIVQDIVDKGRPNLIFDLSKVTYMTSPGLACIMKTVKKLQSIKGTLFLHGATQDMKELLNLTKLGKYVRFV
jgi:anti-anti-sigma factor